MTIIQLQLNLWDQLAQAQRSPQDANWHQLCLAFDTAIDQTPVGLRLATAADAIVEMAEVLAARADEFFSAWRRVPEDGPILDEDLFAEFVRQSFHLELDGLVGVPELYVRTALEKVHGDGESVVEYRGKDEVLAELESFVGEEQEGAIATLEYDEDVGAWANEIQCWLQSQRVRSAAIIELENETGLSLVKLWLAGLLGDFELWQSREFYSVEGVYVQEFSC